MKRKSIQLWRNSHIAVTLELLHVIPSHGVPHGSDFSQLGGVFFHWSFKDWSAPTVHHPHYFRWIKVDRESIGEGRGLEVEVHSLLYYNLNII